MRKYPKCRMFLAMALVGAGCGPDEGSERYSEAMYSLTFGSPQAVASSVVISGERTTAAHPQYPCVSSMPPTCFNLSANDAVAVTGLCTSEVLPLGVWDFEFKLYSSTNCQGEWLNANTGVPLRCFHSRDVFARANANASRGVFMLSATTSNDSIVCATAGLIFLQQPSTVIAGDNMAPAMEVQVTDAFGALQIEAGRSVSLSIVSGPGTFTAGSVTTAVTLSNGRASFGQVAFTVGGTYQLRASSTGLSPVNSEMFEVSSGILEFSDVGPVATRSSDGSVTVSYPSNTQENDLMLLVQVNARDDSITTPTGWTLTADQSTSSPSRFRFTVWRKLAGNETSVNVVVDTRSDGTNLWVIRYRRPEGYPPNPTLATANVVQGVAGNVSSLTPSPSLTTSSSDATVISMVAIRDDSTLTLSNAQGFELRMSEESTRNRDVRLAVADRVVSTSGTTVTSPTWLQSGAPDQWAFMTVAFK